jgi:hypothetical protein
MLKVLAIVAAVILGLTVYVAVQNQRAAEQTINKTAQTPKAVAPSQGHEKPQENAENPQGNSPSWYGFFIWPDSTTTWAILLTLWAVAWQANETRRAAEASLKQFVFSKQFHRADIQIRPRPIKFIAIDCGQLLKVRCENIGNSPAKDIKIASHCRVCKEKEITEIEEPLSEVNMGMFRQGEFADALVSISEKGIAGIGPNQFLWYAHLRGVLTYRDIFGDIITATFRFRLWIPSTNDIERCKDAAGGSILTINAVKRWECIEWSERIRPSDQQSQKPN